MQNLVIGGPASRFVSLADALSLSNPRPLIVAHRGVWTTQPENSIASILAAVEAGADIVEIDVQSTADGQLILMHDNDIDRTTNRKGRVTKLTQADLASVVLRAGGGGDLAPLTNHRVPDLAEALETARGRTFLNIDTKNVHDLDAVCNAVLDQRMADQVIVKMSVDPLCPALSILDAPWFGRLVFMPVLLDPRPGTMAVDAMTSATLYNAKMLEISFNSFDELSELRTHAKREGIRLWVNTLDVVHPMDFNDSRAIDDPVVVWGKLIQSGIGVVQTDKTKELAAFLGRSNGPAI